MMARVLENKLRPIGKVKSRLCNLSRKEGEKIGAGLAMSLSGNLTSAAAVDEWILKYPALQELDRAENWFRPMMDTVAMRLLSEVAWGAKFRFSFGAFLSLLDMASDLNVVSKYMLFPETEAYGYALLGMIAACLALQVILVIVQNMKNKKKLVREVLIVFSCLKPALDASRVIRGAEQSMDTIMDPKTELVFTRASELFAESIPGTLLQVHSQISVYMSGGGISKRVVTSIVISALTTGFTSATIW
jgi:hypothetical protein